MSAEPRTDAEHSPVRYASLSPADRARLLLADIQHLQEQLGDRNRTTREGQRIDGTDYWAWRQRAQHALRYRLEEYRAAKAEAKAAAKAAPPTTESAKAGGMTPRASALLKRALDAMFEDTDARIEPLSDNTCVVRIIGDEFADIVIYAAAVVAGGTEWGR